MADVSDTTPIAVTFPLAIWHLVAECLADRTYRQTASVIALLREQVQQQLVPPAPAPLKPPSAKPAPKT